MDRGGLWPSEDDVPNFRVCMESFAAKSHNVALLLLSCLAESLGLPPGYFGSKHDLSQPDNQCTLRLLHYPPTDPSLSSITADGKRFFRAGPHTE